MKRLLRLFPSLLIVSLATLDSTSLAETKKLRTELEKVSTSNLPIPKPLPEKLKDSALMVLPDGSILVSGTKNNVALSYRWSPENDMWNPIEGFLVPTYKPEVAVSPLNPAYLGIAKSFSISLDGGRTWQKREIAGGWLDLWSAKKAETFFCLLRKGDRTNEKTEIYECDVTTRNKTLISTIDGVVCWSKQSDGKHYLWLGHARTDPIQCLASDDDCRTWKQVSVGDTPFAGIASARKVILSTKDNNVAAVDVVQLEDVTFCNLEPMGGPADPLQEFTFFSKDHGNSWLPPVLNKRTSDVRSIFAGSPFCGKNAKDKFQVRGLADLQCNDKKRVFAKKWTKQGPEWFATTVEARTWQQIITPPEPGIDAALDVIAKLPLGRLTYVGEPVPVGSGFDKTIFYMATDGQEHRFAPGELWSVPINSSKILSTPITSDFATIQDFNTEGKSRRELTKCDQAYLSPDGRKILLLKVIPFSFSAIATIQNLADGITKPLPINIIFRPSWSPDGKKIAYSARDSSNTDQICVLEIGSTNPIVVAKDADGCCDPCWSPDGRKIAWQSGRIGTFNKCSIVVANADGSAPLKLESKSKDSYPAWSPDGNWIAFVSQGRQLGICMMKPDGSERTELARAKERVNISRLIWTK